MFIIPFWYGGFYEYTAFISGIFFVILLYKITRENKQIIICKSKNFIFYSILILSYLIVSVYAIDKEMAIEGFLKFLPSIFYFLILMQLKKDKKQILWNIIPISGAVMCIISFVLQLMPFVEINFFSENGRFIGFFQYSNTLALFLLIGIVVIANKEKMSIMDKVTLIILIIGMLLTGSRTTFILAILFGIYQIIKRRNNKKQIAIILGIIIVVIGISFVMLMISQDSNVLSRLLKISFNSSTLLGRVVYNLDGLKLLLEHPLGLGYMGYSYIYKEIQTANYITKFVHNDLLQQGLDTGIIAMLILAYLFITNIFSKKSSLYKKEMLTLIFIHMLLEFDMQFAIINFIFVMLLEETEGKVIIFKLNDKIINTGIALILIGIFSYFSIATYADKKRKL